MKKSIVTTIGLCLLVVASLSLAGCADNGAVEGTASSEQVQATTPEAQAAGISDEMLGAVQTTAERFAERFGTFTNQDDFANYENLQNYATPEMQSWMQNFIAERKKEYADQKINFYGVTTSAVVSHILTARPDTIKVLVDTKREEITDTNEDPKVTYQNIIIEMKNVKGDWKVNFAQFEKT